MGKKWGQLERLAQNRDAWRKLVGGLCPRWDHRRRDEIPNKVKYERSAWLIFGNGSFGNKINTKCHSY
ncbi:hypothetical protein DPMN_117039 [Dreissena polymorpha]|uniref:Uncharacterized protein n=1 Tax=Dreissena polymorpha TaxID=45954 RepID=A0A9D4KPS1_DREPO|nr:hypothetical protein DPMN_117039 [Dreissena polymorpha]